MDRMAVTGNEHDEHDDQSFRWGTWEELLLAFAVKRHGDGAWASIASELLKRSSVPNLSLTAQNCRQKYLDLRRRYVARNEDESVNDDVSNDDATADSLPLLEELRKLRVAELRQEVRRYDLSIEALELKMKSMEEEREKSSRREKLETDLENNSEENRVEKDVKREEKPLPAVARSGDLLAGEESEKDHMSVNESNSSDLGAAKIRTSEKTLEPLETERPNVGRNRNGETSEEPVDLKAKQHRKSIREDSCNGSSNSIDKVSSKDAPREPESESDDSAELESESKGGDETTKENSGVQSSASRSKKEKGNDKVRRGSTSGDRRDNEDQSRAVKELSSQSQPFVDLLQEIRSTKLGSVFDRRLLSQESPKYQQMIRHHMDLKTVETRLKEGWYSGSSTKFYRDLLLLVNNALVFFSKTSSEAQAAIEIRQLISKDMSQKLTKSDSSTGKQISLQSLSLPRKDGHQPPQSSLLKPRISGPLIVCRKRSSIAAKATSAEADRKKEQTSSPADEDNSKPLPSSQPSGDAEEPKITKRRTRDLLPSVSANSKKNGKNQLSDNGNKNPATESGKQPGKVGASSPQSEPKGEKKKNQSSIDSKKRGAANFLNRMKQSSSPTNGLLLDALKNTPLTSESTSSKAGSKPKKNDNTSGGEKKGNQASRRTADTRPAKEKNSGKKRSVGRPPKTGAAPSGKRGRQRGEAEPAASKPPKKRSRKF